MTKSAWNIRGMVFTALFAALFVIFSAIKVSIGISAVPFTLQTLAIMLTGGILGPRYGFFSIFIVVALTALGLPLLHGEGGWSLLVGGTAGFIWMFAPSALLIGWFSEKVRGNNAVQFLSLFAIMVVFGILLLYAGGVPWYAHVADISLGKAISVAAVPFILPDLLKAVVAAAVVLAVRKSVPALSPSRA